MNSFKQFDKLIDFWVVNRMPIEQNLYFSNIEMRETIDFLKDISSNGVTEVRYPESEHGAIVTKIHYRGYRINIINIDSLP